MKTRVGRSLVSAFAIAAPFHAAQALAQAAPDPAPSPAPSAAAASAATDIVVTARKRNETVQHVPISIEVIGGSTIAKTGVSSLLDLPSIAPGVTLANPPAGAEPGVTIRGLGSAPGAPSFDSSVSLFVDGVYAPRAREFAGSLFDVQRLEVIRGTQAALLGKNTSLGAINLITRKPGSEFEADIRTSYDFELKSHLVAGGVDIPVSDQLQIRVAGQSNFEGGWVYNTINHTRNARTHDNAIRAIAVWRPNDAIDVTALAQHDVTRVQGNPTEFIALSNVPAPLAAILQAAAGYPGTLDSNLDRVNATFFQRPGGEQSERLPIDRYGLTANYRAGDYTITSVSGYSKYTDQNNFDADSQAGNWSERDVNERSRQFSQELRLVSPANQPLEYVVGALYIDNTLFNQTTLTANYPFGPAPGVLLTGSSRTNFDQTTRTESAFAQATYHLAQNIRALGGLRYTHEDKTVALGRDVLVPGFYSLVANPPYAPFTLKHSEDNVDYSVGLQADLGPNALTYISYGKGTKGGGFASSATLLDHSAYTNEVAKTLEAGVKLQDAGRNWLLNLALFDTNVHGFQTVTFNGVSFDITNQNLVSRGFEVESSWNPVRGLRLYANGTYADAKDRDSGRRVPLAPKIQGSAGFNYKTALTNSLELRVDGSVDHRSSRSSQIDPAVPLSAPFTPLNASIAIGSFNQKWEVRLIGRNLTNANSAEFVFPTPFLPAGNYNAVSERSRTVTLQLSAKY